MNSIYNTDHNGHKISIIMPAYNVENYIAESINSVLKQTVLPFELIIVNDGSTDNTREVIRQFEDNPLVKVLDKENEGLGPTRNFGLSAASGDYIYFFDSDDLLTKDFIEFIEKTIEMHGAPDLIMFSGESFLDKDFESSYCPKYKRNISGLFKKSDRPNTKLYNAKCYFPSACLYVSKKALWQEKNFTFKNIIHEDEEIIFPLISDANSIYISEQVFFLRRIRENSLMTSNKNIGHLDAYQTIFKSLCEFSKNHRTSDYFDVFVCKKRQRLFFNAYLSLGKILNPAGYSKEAVIMFIEARRPILILELFKIYALKKTYKFN